MELKHACNRKENHTKTFTGGNKFNNLIMGGRSRSKKSISISCEEFYF